jgi:hypothetical protein
MQIVFLGGWGGSLKLHSANHYPYWKGHIHQLFISQNEIRIKVKWEEEMKKYLNLSLHHHKHTWGCPESGKCPLSRHIQQHHLLVEVIQMKKAELLHQ